MSQLEKSLELVQKAPLVGLDSETTGLAWHQDVVVGVSWATHTHAWYMPICHAEGRNLPQGMEPLAEALFDATNAGTLLVGANLTFDVKFLQRFKCWDWLVGVGYHDVQILAYTFNENQPLKLEELAGRYLGVAGDEHEKELMQAIAAKLGKKKAAKADKAKMGLLDGQMVAPYACADAWHCCHLLDKLIPICKADGTWNTYLDLLKYQRCLTRMEMNGLPVLKDVMAENWKAAEVERDRLRQKVVDLSGGVVANPGSPKQLGGWLRLDSTSKQALEDELGRLDRVEAAGEPVAENAREAIDTVLDYRKWAKAVSTYYKAINDNVGDGDVLYPTLRLTGAAVRLSASNPNMQAIPRKGGKQYKIKDFLGSSDPDILILEADLSQAEIVMGAHLTDDPTLRGVLLDGVDMHTAMKDKAFEMFEVEVTRQQAKGLNFALQYGAQAAKMGQMLKLPLETAKLLVQAHKGLYPGLHRTSAYAQNSMKVKKHLTLWSGRKRHWYPGFKEHSALNALVQGGVSELMRVAIVKLFRDVPEVKWGLTVHDSVIGTVHRKDLEAAIPKIKAAMTDFPWLKVPVHCDVDVGNTWATVETV